MAIEYDPEKNKQNIKDRGISFDEFKNLDFESAIIEVDNRKDYGEDRHIIQAKLNNRLYIAVITIRGDDITRVISLRKANKKEVKRYEEALN